MALVRCEFSSVNVANRFASRPGIAGLKRKKSEYNSSNWKSSGKSRLGDAMADKNGHCSTGTICDSLFRISINPSVGLVWPVKSCTKVDFPDPLCPLILNLQAWVMSKSSFRKTHWFPYRFPAPRSVTDTTVLIRFRLTELRAADHTLFR